MNCAEFHDTILAPASAFLAKIDARLSTPAADRLLLAIAGQESRWQNIPQAGGPAVDPWQHEPGSIRDLIRNETTQRYMHALARACGVAIFPDAIFAGLLSDARLSYGCARLLLWADPHPLPTTEDDAWGCYLRVWRPGKPRHHDWAANWAAACGVITTPTPLPLVGGCSSPTPEPSPAETEI